MTIATTDRAALHDQVIAAERVIGSLTRSVARDMPDVRCQMIVDARHNLRRAQMQLEQTT